jgi:heptosyltransferase-2
MAGRLVILAPNWLGDAVLALPAVADIRRAWPGSPIAVAARASIAPLFHLVCDVDEVVTLPGPGWRQQRRQRHERHESHRGTSLADRGFEIALLLPNSWHAALTAARARIPERWGYRADWRGGLLTRAIERPPAVHQAAYYQHLVRALGFPNGAMEPRLPVPDGARESGVALLKSTGWDGRAPLVAVAPGAAYGGAKRWPPESFASLAVTLTEDGVRTVMVGSGSDRETAAQVLRAFEASGQTRDGVLDLVGRTDLAALAGVLAACRAVVSNDSGPMHLAAAVGTPVTAIFGATNEHRTGPLGVGHTIVAHDTWCRPCLLRECPLDHGCMRGVEVAPVLAATRRML